MRAAVSDLFTNKKAALTNIAWRSMVSNNKNSTGAAMPDVPILISTVPVCFMLHAHKELTETLNVVDIAREFIATNDE